MIAFASTESFAGWVLIQTQRYTVSLEVPLDVEVAVREALLRATNRWPEVQLTALDVEAEQASRHAEQSHEDEVATDVSALRVQLQSIGVVLFGVNGQTRHTKRKRALELFRAFLGWLRADDDAWGRLDTANRLVLVLPVHKQTEMRALLPLLDSGVKHTWWTAVEKALELLRVSETQAVPALSTTSPELD